MDIHRDWFLVISDPDRYIAEAHVQLEDNLWKSKQPPRRRALRWCPSGQGCPPPRPRLSQERLTLPYAYHRRVA